MSLPVSGIFRSLGNYLFFGNIFISVCALALYWTTCLLLVILPSPGVAVLVFSATLLIYITDSLLPYKLRQQAQFSERRAWVQNHRRSLIILVLFSFLIAVILFFQNRALLPLGFLGHLALISVLYSVPVLPTRSGWVPLRNIPVVKIFLIAYVWSSVTVWLPVLAAQQSIFTPQVWFLFGQRFFFILALTIVFDIRDVARDKSTGTLTLPVLVGIKRSQYLAWASLFIFLGFVLYTQPGKDQLALFLSGLGLAWVIGRAAKPQREYFYVVADGMMLLQFLLLWVLRESLPYVFN